VPKPEVFGLHENADITKDLGEVELMLKTILLTQSQGSGGGGRSAEEVVGDISNDILAKLPANFDMEVIKYSINMHGFVCSAFVLYVLTSSFICVSTWR